jgi:hypothetical protein
VAKRVALARCEWCLREYKPKTKAQRFCGRPCSQDHARRKAYLTHKLGKAPSRVYAREWQPEVGDCLVGVIVAVAPIHTRYGDHPLMALRPEGGELTTVWLGDALEAQLVRQDLGIGDRVFLRYLGRKVRPDNLYAYHTYEVRRPDDGAAQPCLQTELDNRFSRLMEGLD